VTIKRLIYGDLLERREDSNSIMDAPITMEDMRRAIKGSGLTSPGKDDICYVMIEHLGVLTSTKLLGFYNKVWDLGKLPAR